jgi:hypothetical protein
MSYVSSAPVPWRTKRLPLLGCALLSIFVLGLFGGQSSALADTTSYVQSAASFALPAGSTTGAYFQAVQTVCPSQGLCVTVGAVDGSAENAMVEASSAGLSSGAAVQVALPDGASTGGLQDAYLDGVSCQSAALCVAYGYYNDTTNGPTPMIVKIVNGVPAQAVPVPDPPQSLGASFLTVTGVACPPAGDCVAVGNDEVTGSDAWVPLIWDIADGVPQAAVQGPEPTNADTGSYSEVDMDGVACQADGTCMAIGDYPSGGHRVSFVQLIGGPATEVTPPAGVTGDPDETFSNLACPSAGACEAFGYYVDNGGNDVYVTLAISGGSPGSASPIVPPPGQDGQQIDANGLSCSSAVLCVESGDYEDQSSQVQAVLIPITGTGSAVAQESVLPSGQWTGGTDALWASVSCIASGPCLAAGSYQTSSSTQEGMIAQVSASGQIGSTVPTPDPADADPSNAQTTPKSIGCTASGSCVVAASYQPLGTGNEGPELVSEQAPLTLASSSLAGAKQGSPYSATLPTPTGAWGIYSWSVTAGSLPAGLSLNAQTGVISGTPTGSGSSAFTVTVAGTGSPVQTASEQLSLAVTGTQTTTAPAPTPAAAKPLLRLLAASGKLSGKTLGVKLACSAAPCAGTIRLEAVETVTVKKGRKKVHKRETVVLGSAGYSLAAGRSKTVGVTLNGRGRKALEAAKQHRLKVTVLASVSGGEGVSRTETIYSVTKKKR